MSIAKSKAEIEKVVKKKITYKCPVRGVVTQEVNVVIYKAAAAPEEPMLDPDIALLLGGNNITDDLEEAGFHEVED